MPLHLIGDPVRFSQVLLNLLGNAIKFTEKGSVKLSVSLNKEGTFPGIASLHIEVIDTGIGIQKDKLENIFESFKLFIHG